MWRIRLKAKRVDSAIRCAGAPIRLHLGHEHHAQFKVSDEAKRYVMAIIPCALTGSHAPPVPPSSHPTARALRGANERPNDFRLLGFLPIRASPACTATGQPTTTA
jgi:hypothetical protein